MLVQRSFSRPGNSSFDRIAESVPKDADLALDANEPSRFVARIRRHRSGLRVHPWHRKDGIFICARFSEECLYEMPGENRFDVNKLIGMGFGPWPWSHLRSSYRIGWNCETGSGLVCLHHFAHSPQMRYERICEVAVEEPFCAQFKLRAGSVETTVWQGGREVGRSAFVLPGASARIGWVLWPYFGGDEPAPQPMRIDVFHWELLKQ